VDGFCDLDVAMIRVAQHDRLIFVLRRSRRDS
jgi:hypothetical protein